MNADDANEKYSYLEFMFPYRYEPEGADDYEPELGYLTIDFNVSDWFRSRYCEGYEGEEYPPANEDVCTSLMQHFSKNHSYYYSNGLVRDALDDDIGVRSAADLKEELDADRIRFIY